MKQDNSSFESIMSQIENNKKDKQMFEVTYETSSHFSMV